MRDTNFHASSLKNERSNRVSKSMLVHDKSEKEQERFTIGIYNLQICNIFHLHASHTMLCENGYDPARIGSDISGRDVTRARCVSTLGMRQNRLSLQNYL